MPIQTASNASVLIRPNVSGGVVDVVSRPVDLFKFFVNNGLVRPSNGSSPTARPPPGSAAATRSGSKRACRSMAMS